MATERGNMIAAVEGLATQVAIQPRSLMRSLELGLICSAAAVAGRAAFDPLLGEHLPFSMFFPALLFAALFGGAPAALLTLVVSTLSGWFLFLPPKLSFLIADGRGVQIPVFIGIGLFICGIGLVLRSALMRLETHRRRYEAVVFELSERLQKDLAKLAVIAQDSLRETGGRPRGGEAFVDRLAVLRQTHQDLSSLDWRPISLRRVIERPLYCFTPDEAARIALEGIDADLDPDLAVSLALCIWELADNTRRRGALATADGQVRLSWATDGRVVSLSWIETDVGAEAPRDLRRRLENERLSWRLEPATGLVQWTTRFEPRATLSTAPTGRPAQAA